MLRKIYIPLFLFTTFILLLPLVVKGPYYRGILVQVGIFSLITIGLSLLMGYAGQISLGHAAFFGIGAYTSTILTATYGWSPWLAILAGMMGAAVVAWILGTPALKLKGHYLAMATLGFGIIVYIVFEAEHELTGGPSGYTASMIPYLRLGNLVIDNEIKNYYFVWSITIFALLLSLHLIHSRIGRALRAIHSEETAARAMGINAARYKVGIFVLSAVYASLAGSLYAHYILFISPHTFDLMESVLFVMMVIIGGMGSVWGAVTGAALLTILPELLRSFDDFKILIYSCILLFIMLFMRGGLFGGGEILWKKIFGNKRKYNRDDGKASA